MYQTVRPFPINTLSSSSPSHQSPLLSISLRYIQIKVTNMAVSKLCFSLVFSFIYVTVASAGSGSYNVQSFGAKPDGKTDSTKAFVGAWAAACASTAPATIYVPAGRFLVGSLSFGGQTCKSNAISFQMDGTLVAPSDYNNVVGKSGNWIKFEKVTGVSISGGTLDGQGAALWACKNSAKNCPQGATVLTIPKLNKLHQPYIYISIRIIIFSIL